MQAVQQCLDALAAGQPVPQDLARRAMTLLRSRFSSPAFWHKGRTLFEAAAAAAADDVARRELRAYVEQCSEFLGDAPGPSAEQQQPSEQQAARQQQQRYLFEGQLGSGAGEPAAPEPGVRLMGLLAQQLMGAAAEGGSEGHPPQPPSAEVLEAMQQGKQPWRERGGELGWVIVWQQRCQPQLEPPCCIVGAIVLNCITALFLPTCPCSPCCALVPPAELDAIAVQIMEETAGQQPPPGGPPPASKQAVRQLPVEALTAERLQELGGAEARCAVCM